MLVFNTVLILRNCYRPPFREPPDHALLSHPDDQSPGPRSNLSSSRPSLHQRRLGQVDLDRSDARAGLHCHRVGQEVPPPVHLFEEELEEEGHRVLCEL